MTTATATALRTYSIDKAHSEVTFQVRHLLTKVRGRFSDFSGEFAFAEAEPEHSSVTFTIDAATIDTNQPDRDKHLRSADFFDVEVYPTIAFKSTAVAPRSADRFDVTGGLTIHGVTKVVTIAVTYLGAAKDPWGADRVAFEGETTVDRKDFGLNWNAALETGGFLVGDEVKISLSVQAK